MSVAEVKKGNGFEIWDEDKRIVAGYASVEIVDMHGDLIPIEEIKRGMYNLMARGGNILYGHTNKPIGKILSWEIRKHPEANVDALYIVAQIYKDYPIDDEVWQMIKRGILRGFSIGGQGKKAKGFVKGTSKEVNVVHDLNLLEISIVPTPANPLATIEEVNYLAKSISGKKETVAEVKKIDVDSVLKKYGVSRKDLEKLGECDFCEDVKKLYGELGDLDTALKVARLLLIKKENMAELEDMSKNIMKSIEELKRYEDEVLRDRAESLEEGYCPEDEFSGDIEYIEYEKKFVELRKQLEEIKKPFGEWDSFQDCVNDMKSQGYSEESAKRICGSLQAKLEKFHEEGDALSVIAEIIDKVRNAQPLSEVEEEILAEIVDVADEILSEVGEELKEGLENVELAKDKRPPKEWFDRCVDRTGNPTLCGWVFYHHLYPTKPESKREPDEPHTQAARRRKRSWLASRGG